MIEDQKSPSTFKVVDRRTFTEDGAVRERSSEAEKSVQKEEAFASQKTSAPPQAVRIPPPEPESEELAEDSAEGFETLISYLSTTAMFQLGLLPGPSGERMPADLENARRTIDMLELLQHKTRGNLTRDEAKLLEDVLYELRMTFVEVSRRHAQKAK